MMSFFAARTFPARRRLAARSPSSSTVAIATATVFVLVTAAVGLVMDRPPGIGDVGTGWHLRGALGAAGTVLPRQGRA